MKPQFKFLSTSKLEKNPFEIRDKEDTNDVEFQDLVESIKAHGIIQPIIARKEKGKYQVITGMRRVRASKSARLANIPTIVREADDKEARKWTLIENVHRKNLSDTEKAHALKAIYEAYGYSLEESISNLDNIKNHRIRGDKIISPKEFVEICDDTGYESTTQLKFLRLLRDILPQVLKFAEKSGLNIEKKLMLTRPNIRKDIRLQKTVATMIKHVPQREARQLVHNIESGTYKFTGKGFRVAGKSEKILIKPQEFTEESYMIFLRTSNVTRNLLYLLTGLEKKNYTEEDVNRTDDYRLEKVKQLKDHDLNILWNNLSPLKDAVDDMLDKIEEDLDAREKKKKMISR